MGIFRRRDKQAAAEATSDGAAVAATREAEDSEETADAGDLTEGAEATDGATDGATDVSGATGESAVDEAEEADGVDDLDDLDEAEDESFSRARGPFDVSEVADDEPEGDALPERLDLGAIRLVPIDGMQLRLELDETQETVLSALAQVGESSVQLQAFAAPRTFPVWPDIRSEIAESVVAQGGTADTVRGPLGRELLCRMPQRGADGRTVFAQVRFAGVDGPRWFLRAVLSGPAAVDEAAAAPLVELVRSVVVVRGDEAMPPREVLPLRLPQDLQPTEPPAAEGGEGDEGEATVRSDDLKPFERGPEITEVR